MHHCEGGQAFGGVGPVARIIDIAVSCAADGDVGVPKGNVTRGGACEIYL